MEGTTEGSTNDTNLTGPKHPDSRKQTNLKQLSVGNKKSSRCRCRIYVEYVNSLLDP